MVRPTQQHNTGKWWDSRRRLTSPGANPWVWQAPGSVLSIQNICQFLRSPYWQYNKLWCWSLICVTLMKRNKVTVEEEGVVATFCVGAMTRGVSIAPGPQGWWSLLLQTSSSNWIANTNRFITNMHVILYIKYKQKENLFPYQEVEVYTVVRCWGSHFVYTVGSQMAVMLSALRTGSALLPQNVIFSASGTPWC
jgi:hypothetical protein